MGSIHESRNTDYSIIMKPWSDPVSPPTEEVHEGLLGGGIGYVFADNRAKKMKEGDEAGYFLVQFT
ncbi:hypothetical protein CEC48_00930 [Pseudomonas sp. K2I15]|nr:hypothetical protein CEC48_00930 [Pseudomonas sp. K2I15]